MNTREEQQLTRFLNGLVQTQVASVDRQALGLIEQAFAQQPHAAYLLTQRSLALSIAVEAAQQKISELEAQLAGANPWGRQAGLRNPGAAALAQQNQPQSSWSQGLMGSLLGAAAGVMIGQALWQGMQHMMSDPGEGIGAGSDLDQQLTDGGVGQQAQSAWADGLSLDEGAFDGGDGNDWL
ncbi:MAG: DUF2076 family protein [Betaproteobacteria bacterium]